MGVQIIWRQNDRLPTTNDLLPTFSFEVPEAKRNPVSAAHGAEGVAGVGSAKVAITTGLRKGELLGLKWSDLDWDTNQLNVQRQIQRVPEKGLTYSQPKTAAGRRMIIMMSDTISTLKDHKKRQWVEREFHGEKWQDHDLIFPSSIRTPLSQNNLNRDYKQLLNEANLPNIRFHDLRHTAASLMLKQGISVKVVQERLGRSDAAMTLNVYSHVIPGMQREAAEKMDEITALIDISEMLEKVEDQNGLQ